MAIFYNRSKIKDIKKQILIFFMFINIEMLLMYTNFQKANYKRQQGPHGIHSLHFPLT
jgi:hypothetical protein